MRWLGGCLAWRREGDEKGGGVTQQLVAEVCNGMMCHPGLYGLE